MSRSTTPPPADHLAVAHARLRTWIGIDPARGGIGRAVARHVATRVDALGRPSSEEYARRLSSPRSEEGQHLVRAATVPHSWLARHVEPLEELLARLGERGRTAHVWVAGCAGGEEVYTLAALGRARGVPLTVLGTDVNDAALRRAARGRYDAWTARALPPALRPWLADDGRGGAVATATLREGVAFAHHSLLSAPPPAPDEGGWDAVVCRNVLIYFPRAAALSTVGALRSALGPEGMLVLGASDVLAEVPRGLAPRPERRSFFERVGGASGAPEGRAPNVPRRPALATAPGRARAAARPDPVVTHASAGVPEATSVAPAEVPGRAAEGTASEDPAEALAAGDAERAGGLAAERLAADPTDEVAHLLAGLAAHARGDHAAAIVSLRAAACLGDGWLAWFYLGLARERLGRWSAAARAFRQVAHARGPAPPGDGALWTELRAARPALIELAHRRASALSRDTEKP